MAYLLPETACFHSNSLENLYQLLPCALNFSCLPQRNGQTFNKPQNKARPEGKVHPALGRSPRCAWVLIHRTSRIKVIQGTSFTVTQKPAARVLSWSPDQGYNRAVSQFLPPLFLADGTAGLVNTRTRAGREANFGSDCLTSASGEVGPHCWAFAFSLFHLARAASVRQSRLVTVS